MHNRIARVTLALAALLAFGIAQALDYPKSAISLIVPAGAGGGTDLTARAFAKYAKDLLGQNLVVVNVSGGGGFNGTKRAHDSKPDGYTVLFFHNGIVLNKLAGVASYSFEEFEFGPRTASDPSTALFINASSKQWADPKKFIEAVKAKPNGISTATEVGSYTYFLLLSLQNAFDIKFKVVDIGSNSAKSTALLGGHIDSMPNSYATNQGYIQSGDFICLGLVAPQRSPIFPDVPTLKEQGVDFTFGGYEIGMWFPKGTPKEIIAKFDEVAKKVSENKDYQADMLKLGYVNAYLSSEDNRKLFTELQDTYTKLAESVK